MMHIGAIDKTTCALGRNHVRFNSGDISLVKCQTTYFTIDFVLYYIMFYRVTRFLVVLLDNVNLPTQTAQYNYNTNIDLQHDGSHAMDNSKRFL